MTEVINDTVYSTEQLPYIEYLRSDLEAKMLAKGLDFEAFFESWDGEKSLEISKNDPDYWPMLLMACQYAYLTLKYTEYGGEQDIFSLSGDVSFDWASYEEAEAAGASELVDFALTWVQDNPESLAALTTLNYGTQKGNEVLNFLNGEMAQLNTSSSDTTEVTLEQARAIADAYGLDGIEDFASQEESALELQASLLKQIAEANEYFAEIMADPNMSEEMKQAAADNTNGTIQGLQLMYKYSLETTSTMAQMLSDFERKRSETESQLQNAIA